MKTNQAAKSIAELTTEMAKPRAAASVLAFTGYECSRCGRRFPETHPRKSQTTAESRRIEEAHAAGDFALHVCSERGWPPVRRQVPLKGSH
jgi:hypothetical protein